MKEAFEEWLRNRPVIVQELARRFPRGSLWQRKNDPEIGIFTPVAYADDGTLRMGSYGPRGVPFRQELYLPMEPDDFEPCSNAIEVTEMIDGVQMKGYRRQTAGVHEAPPLVPQSAPIINQKIADQYAADRREFFRRAFLMLGFNGIAGDYAEFGCYSGTTFRLAFEAYKGAREHLSFVSYPLERRLWALDSFRGLPRPSSPHDAHPAWTEGNLAMSIDDFHIACERSGIPRDSYKTVEGYYSDTLNPADDSADLPQDIALAYIDCDLYSSISTVFNYLQPHLKHGMVIALDDYFIYSATEPSGARRATVEFFSRLDEWRLVPYMQYGWSGMSYVLESADTLANETIARLHGFI